MELGKNNNKGEQLPEATVHARAVALREMVRYAETLGNSCDTAIDSGDSQRLVDTLEARRIALLRIGQECNELRSILTGDLAYSLPLSRLLNEIDAAMDAVVSSDVDRFARLETARDAVAKELGAVRGNGRAVGAYAPRRSAIAMIEDRTA